MLSGGITAYLRMNATGSLIKRAFFPSDITGCSDYNLNYTAITVTLTCRTPTARFPAFRRIADIPKPQRASHRRRPGRRHRASRPSPPHGSRYRTAGLYRNPRRFCRPSRHTPADDHRASRKTPRRETRSWPPIARGCTGGVLRMPEPAFSIEDAHLRFETRKRRRLLQDQARFWVGRLQAPNERPTPLRKH